MVKSDLIKAVSAKLEIPHHKAEVAVDAFFGALVESLARGQRVEIRGFGTFGSREYASYLGRNPKTGDSVTVAPKVLPFYKMGKELKNAVNGQ
jgi:integration host factor subunit beta